MGEQQQVDDRRQEQGAEPAPAPHETDTPATDVEHAVDRGGDDVESEEDVPEPDEAQQDEPEGDHSDSPMGELDDDGPDASPEVAIAESLRNALQAIRADADAIEALPSGDQRAEAAERLAEDAGALDEQIGSIARADGEHD